MPSYDNKVLTGDQLVYYSGLVKTALATKADASALANKQDALVFNTAYNASSNKVATMADIPANAAANIDLVDGCGLGWVEDEETGDNLLSFDPTAIPLGEGLTWDMRGDPEQDEPVYYVLTPNVNSMGYMDAYNVVVSWTTTEDPVTGEETSEIDETLESALTGINTAISGKQDALVFNTAYNSVSNKVATMSDITTALGGISSFSFEIVQSLPQSNISTSKIYLVAKATSGTNQVYTEYAYVNNAWEIIGDTQMTIDTLSNAEVSTIWSTATATV